MGVDRGLARWYAYTMREKQWNMRMNEAELARLAVVAEHYCIPMTALIRMLVKREVDRLGLSVKKADK